MKHVLFIHHCGIYGGASKSLFEAISNFPKGEIKPYLITQKGNVSKIAKENQIETIETLGISSLDNTRTQPRGFKFILISVRELFYFLPTLLAFYKARKRWGAEIDLIHLNEITLAMNAFFLTKLFKCPIIIHARSVQYDRNNLLAKIIKFFCENYIKSIVAIDSNVRKSLPLEKNISIIHNGLFTDANKLQKDKNHRSLIFGFVANFYESKGIYELLEAINICINEYKLKDLKFLFYGKNPRSTKTIIGKLLITFGLIKDFDLFINDFIKENSLSEYIELKGFEKNLEKVFDNMDVLCFPSRLDAVGRSIFEAAFFSVPSIVALTTYEDDAIIHNETGICIPPKDARALADAIKYFYENPSEVERMGKNANELAWKNFDIKKNALKLLNVYREVLEKSH